LKVGRSEPAQQRMSGSEDVPPSQRQKTTGSRKMFRVVSSGASLRIQACEVEPLQSWISCGTTERQRTGLMR